jgi:hypothetical protein
MDKQFRCTTVPGFCVKVQTASRPVDRLELIITRPAVRPDLQPAMIMTMWAGVQQALTHPSPGVLSVGMTCGSWLTSVATG